MFYLLFSPGAGINIDTKQCPFLQVASVVSSLGVFRYIQFVLYSFIIVINIVL